ncbi:YchJ family metal-binding protein [Pseudoclavibacter sp. JAI123]|uniref:YchJ family protein n=1 Tax=Pseudoclavibacter sp. JAI123 TaxID=2723065 RepID=UPI0015CCE550|nr:YchJ family metal-binding protein [Pseudoclavibacter sp. JAI123]
MSAPEGSPRGSSRAAAEDAGNTAPPAADVCPCGSRLTYESCCGAFHAGRPAPTAEALMRSRYSAFALGLPGYLAETWAEATRPDEIDLDDGTVWRRLQIVDTLDGGPEDESGVVEFRAAYRDPDGAGLLHERARFIRDEGRWVYLDGQIRGS